MGREENSTANINPGVLVLVRVHSKLLLHNTLFPRLVNKFAVASWRFITKRLHPRANELVRLFPGTTSSSRQPWEEKWQRVMGCSPPFICWHQFCVARSSPCPWGRAEPGPRGKCRRGWPMEGGREAGQRLGSLLPAASVQALCFTTSTTSLEVKGDDFYPPHKGGKWH